MHFIHLSGFWRNETCNFDACVGGIYADLLQSEPLIVNGKLRAKQFGAEWLR